MPGRALTSRAAIMDADSTAEEIDAQVHAMLRPCAGQATAGYPMGRHELGVLPIDWAGAGRVPYRKESVTWLLKLTVWCCRPAVVSS
jgi:hypothetical protein